MKIGVWNFVNLFNEVVHVFTFDTEWDFLRHTTSERYDFSGKLSSRKGVFFKIALFNVVFFNVASTKSSNIAGILSFGGLLGLIRKRLVEFRLDFLAFQN